MTTKKFPFKNAADASTGFLMWQAHAVWQRQVTAALRVHELTQVQFALLASTLWLSKFESEITQIRIARHAKLDVMMTSQVLRSLEKRGLLTRQAHSSDTRAKTILLTDAGQALVLRAIPDVESVDEQFFSELGAERATFNTLLQSLIKNSKEK